MHAVNMYSTVTVTLFEDAFFSFVFAVAVTSQPSNESELQLYRVLQRANLLAYFDVFIAQGRYWYIIAF